MRIIYYKHLIYLIIAHFELKLSYIHQSIKLTMLENKKYTLLIVDDEPTNIAVLNAMLRGTYRVKAALNGKDAIKIANSYPQPNLILLDVIMDGLNGFEVCEILKNQDETRDIPIVFVTALNETKNEKKGITLGAIDFFAKPYSAPIILKRIENHLKLRKISKELEALQKTLGVVVPIKDN